MMSPELAVSPELAAPELADVPGTRCPRNSVMAPELACLSFLGFPSTAKWYDPVRNKRFIFKGTVVQMIGGAAAGGAVQPLLDLELVLAVRVEVADNLGVS